LIDEADLDEHRGHGGAEQQLIGVWRTPQSPSGPR
jgi:hypothetical protein